MTTDILRRRWPTYAELDAFYGNPRSGDPARPSPAWERDNLIRIAPPYRMTYAGQPVRTILIHRRCADALLGILDALWDAAGRDQKTVDHWGVSIFGGSYNYRLMRGSNALSVHSWGAAIDLDPARNGLGNRKPRFAKFPAVIKAFGATGARWGGDWDGDGQTADEPRCDGMHIEFCRRG